MATHPTLAGMMAELQSLGTEQNRKIYRRHGAGENQFGVSFKNLRSIGKRLKPDNPLAEALWATGNQDARVLAILTADARTLDETVFDRWATEIDNYTLAEMMANDLLKTSPLAREKADAWTRSTANFVEQTGWNLVAVLALEKNDLPDAYFEAYLQRIEAEIDSAKNRVRHTMNAALIAIGVRNTNLRAKAETVAAGIGRIEVDHGETGCVTPEALPYIERTWARKAKSA